MTDEFHFMTEPTCDKRYRDIAATTQLETLDDSCIAKYGLDRLRHELQMLFVFPRWRRGPV